MNNDKQSKLLDYAIGVMAKSPRLGQVKTRLARDIGEKAALVLYQQMLQRIEEELLSAAPARYDFHWFVDPPDIAETIELTTCPYSGVHPQSSGDLGQRMSSAFTVLLKDYHKVTLIGADIPDLSLAHLESAEKALDQADVALGPTTDGGYYLIAMRQLHRELFTAVPWSSSDTLKQTLKVCAQSGLRCQLLSELSDLDTIDDLKNIIWTPRHRVELLHPPTDDSPTNKK